MGAGDVSAEPVSRGGAALGKHFRREKSKYSREDGEPGWSQAVFLQVHTFCAPAACQALCRMLTTGDQDILSMGTFAVLGGERHIYNLL